MNAFEKTLAKIFGTKHEREIKRMRPMVAAIGELEPQMQALSDEDLAAQTVKFREQLAQGATLDDLLIPAFATVREAGRRLLNMRHFDVQLIGGVVLHRGKIAEMKTGEGKTLVATLPVYLNALEGKGVHVVTVNDYLAHRDSEWMGRIYKALGMNVGVIVHDLDDDERRNAYVDLGRLRSRTVKLYRAADRGYRRRVNRGCWSDAAGCSAVGSKRELPLSCCTLLAPAVRTKPARRP